MRALWFLLAVGCSGSPTTQDGGADAQTDGVDDSATDGSTDGTSSPRCNPLAPFGAPTPIAFDRPAQLPRLSPDEKTLYVGGMSMITKFDTIYFATRADTSSAFGPSMKVLGDPKIDRSPSVTADGLQIVFQSMRSSVDEPMLAVRPALDKPWSTTSALGFTNLDPNETRDAFIRADGKVLYVTFTLGGSGDHIRRGARTGPLGFGMMNIVTELDTSSGEVAPVVTPDDLTMFFGREGNSGEYHIWSARRAKETDVWSSIQLVAELDDPKSQQPGWVSADGCVLYFHRDPNGSGGDLFFAKRGM